jgi:hypothetical protein
LVLLIASCSGNGGASAPDEVARRDAPTTVSDRGTPTTAAAVVAPLRGSEAQDRDSAGRPALLVKIDNRPEARPQVGLNDADIVFEELTEGGITRFLAVYQSRLPADVGPIRSVRPVDPALASPLRGVFAFSGGTPPNVAAIERAPVVAIDETRAGKAMHRIHDRVPPHNLFGTPAKLQEFAAPDAHAPRPLFEYNDIPRAGQPCTSVIVAFSADYQSRYDWSPTDHSWHRSMAGQPFLSSGVQVAPTNLIVLWVADQSPEATLGLGRALVFRDGTVEDGIWARTKVADAFHLTDVAGTPIPLAVGTTWIHLAIVDNTAVWTCVPTP